MIKKLILFILLIPSLCFGGSIQDAHKAVIAKMPTNGLIGSSTYSVPGAAIVNYWYYSQWTPTTPGMVRYLHTYVRENQAGTSTMCLAIWSDAPGTPATLLGSCSVTWEDGDSPGYQHCDTGSAFKISAGVTYHLGLAETAGAVGLYYANEGTAVDYDDSYSACATDNTLQDDGDLGSNDLSIFADNIDQAGP